ncbi:hypothetical protein COX86_01010 [Candidatus Micrarchaeota archaeon CG_4_10_14_0_2_um_filter_60_11]|nr:MAG: hypothetical protein AUJ16_03390 [Candidatus Micrarchaeota archaeon CG1_02_60_51]PIN95790.1 MAG: hypothetical protein COU39_04130 [Candidatus Micrarchaeota archaeon CG10_big_fil_rev_8_21_14_0_10_60_32]PIO01771.1 MAG: hypothetical protein COT58_03350 [Candidatus Micrarchaeota archaeon CG09_land_8_20_14_0_10_60_16]PIY91484.1 MAG: hypothetical protein COY71_02905 [Candidatus Micrarchaeota archaeon CG_4_10_14_0_8_um_filter_60_7]PIZ91166.1 MAG: hypothetical protein COX86_01010 [Candidatus Mi
MGKVLTLLRISPAEGVTIEELLERVKKVPGFNTGKIEDFVFGTKIVKASFVCEDKESKDYQEIVAAVEGVENAQVEECGLIS